ncbi:hypothetical protein [Capnocytophaga catalasegens]|uniref:DUF5673 domain-containing protein n=1 Tax=Capnocytophaga catalasegens TaxID=1004260 RepID=A0AAV5AR41_9FLAO|nr:hypothetical protein [Capnocytophaga catalasegens]GIZ15771.1 hypothetical protein RCZ03_17710 [Capnocytophaga catalasegens]GJM49783.1 hypothetical protein RCZ15_07580 [Capnocytophaga catalasegens]GJM52948.1 hypothetical protein RCZ16_12650 [Capnocytophaga catalasegens]
MKGTIPHQLNYIINGENIEFVSFSQRNATWSNTIFSFLMGLIFIVMGIFVLNFEMGLFAFLRGEYDQTTNIMELISESRLPVLVIGSLFSLAGMWVSVSAIFMIFSEGGYFVGTPTRLIHYKKGDVRIYVWELFTDEIKVDIDKKHIRFTLKIGKYERQDKHEVFVPSKIEIVSAENVSKIERVAREQIASLSYSEK